MFGDKPQAIENMLSYRQGINNIELQWSLTENFGVKNGLKRDYTTKYSNNKWVHSDRDENFLIDNEGALATNRQVNTVVKQFDVIEDDKKRLLGIMNPLNVGIDSVASPYWREKTLIDQATNFTETNKDGIYTVKGIIGNDLEATWVIDSNKGWNAEKIFLTENGVKIHETNITLSKTDGVWFPVKCESKDRNGKTVAIFECNKVIVDELPDDLSYDDMGVDSGYVIEYVQRTDEFGQPMREIWDGEKTVDINVWNSPGYNRYYGPKTRQAKHIEQNKWEEYVMNFIKENSTSNKKQAIKTLITYEKLAGHELKNTETGDKESLNKLINNYEKNPKLKKMFEELKGKLEVLAKK